MATNAERVAALRDEFAPGNRFGALTAIEYLSAGRVRVACDCGAVKVVLASDVRRGATGSCGRAGCPFVRRGRPKTHGATGTPEYMAWAAIKQRIFNPRHPAYVYYGGRGLTMESTWVDDFGAFLEEVGPRP